ncbi:MAG: prenyltransferase/squalene oxidase repeat-containing protein [Planctomycetota bacterium]
MTKPPAIGLAGLWCCLAVVCAVLVVGCEERWNPAESGPALAMIAPTPNADIQGAIDDGIDFLLATQKPNGSWGTSYSKPFDVLCPPPGGPRAFKMGTTALCIMALIEAGGDDPRVVAAIDRAEQWLLTYLPRLRRDSVPTLYNCWGHAYAIQALLALRDRPGVDAARLERIDELIRLQIHLLSRYQSVNGGWGYYNNGAYITSPPYIVGHTHTTATAMIALREASEAGFDVPDRIVQRGLRGLKWARNPDFSYDYHIFFSYKNPTDALSKPPGSLGRSQVCNAAMYLWNDSRTTLPIIETWLNRLYARNGWLELGRKTYLPHESHYRVAGYFFYYGHYYAAICMEFLPPDDRPYHQAHLAKIIVDRQDGDGSWWDFIAFDFHQYYGTSFALMTLQRCLSNE